MPSSSRHAVGGIVEPLPGLTLDLRGETARACGTPRLHFVRMQGALGQVFDPRQNALNAWRLVLAAGVILQHSWPITGRDLDTPLIQLFTQVFVDGFFVVSGFLIVRSWLNNPRLRDYAAARLLRIFPGLWVCVVSIAFVLAPIGVALSQGVVAAVVADRLRAQ